MNEDEIGNAKEAWITIGEDGSSRGFGKKPSLKEMQEYVGGYIEYAPVKEGATLPIPREDGKCSLAKIIDVVANEEGLLLGLKENSIVSPRCECPIVGNVIVHVVMTDDDVVMDITDFFAEELGLSTKSMGFLVHGIHHFVEVSL